MFFTRKKTWSKNENVRDIGDTALPVIPFRKVTIFSFRLPIHA